MTGAVGVVAHARRGSFMYGVHSVCVQCVFGIQCVSVKIEFVGALFHCGRGLLLLCGDPV
jgi:hypothetical protein